MSNMQVPNQSTGNIFIGNMTVMPQPQTAQGSYPQIISPLHSPYNPSVQTSPLTSDHYEQMRIINQNYQTAKQYQKNSIEFHEQQNLHARYKAILGTPLLPIQSGIVGEDDNIPIFHNSPLWNVAQWSIASTGLTILQALCAIITCICAATWGRIRISCNKANDWLEPLILWTMFFAESGQGKSILFSRLLAPFNEFQKARNRTLTSPLYEEMQEIMKQAVKDERKRIRRDFDINDPKTLERLESNLNALHSTEFYKLISQKNNPVTLTITSATENGLLKILARNGNAVFIATPEPDSLISLLKNDGTELLKKSYNQETDNYISGHRENLLNSPSVSLLCGCQTDIYFDHIHSKSYRRQQDGGFWARVLPILSHKKMNSSGLMAPYFSASGKNHYESRITELLTHFYTQNKQAEKYTLVCDCEAIKFLENIRQQFVQQPVADPAFRAWVAKFAGNLARIAGALHLWEYGLEGLKRKVGVNCVYMASEIMHLVWHHAWHLYSDCGLVAETYALRIQQSLIGMNDYLQYQRIMAEGISTAEISSRIRLGREQINTSLRILQANNWCVILDRGHGNLLARFRPEFFVNSQ